jgi:D-arginine dehydrogenase
LLAEYQVLSQAIQEIPIDEACRLMPILDHGYAAAAAYDPDSKSMDVNAIHQGYLRALKVRGGEVVTHAEVRRIARRDGLWRVDTPAGAFAAPLLVNAAGAWADEIAKLAGVRPIGLVPKRRTVIVFDAPDGIDSRTLPATADVDELWYLKPEAGRILGSPADETPVPPQDVQPEEIDKALAIDRIETATTLKIERIVQSWAGLRSFVADKQPVVGYDTGADGFFWLAGQGGYGIQTAAAMGRAAADLAGGLGLPDDMQGLGITAADLAPERLAG